MHGSRAHEAVRMAATPRRVWRRDLHECIIYHMREMIGGHTVVFEQHLVIELRSIERDPAAGFKS
jgi:hypothetical protein